MKNLTAIALFAWVIVSAGAAAGADDAAPAPAAATPWYGYAWTDPEQPYLAVQREIEAKKAHGTPLPVIVSMYRAKYEANQQDPLAAYGFAYAAWLKQLLPTSSWHGIDDQETIKAIEEVSAPHSYRYVRLRFIYDALDGPDGDDYEAGRRLLHHDPNDYDVIISDLYVLRIGTNQAETKTAFNLCHRLLKLRPHDRQTYRALFLTYDVAWSWQNNDAERRIAIQYGKAFLKVAPPNDNFNTLAQNYLKELETPGPPEGWSKLPRNHLHSSSSHTSNVTSYLTALSVIDLGTLGGEMSGGRCINSKTQITGQAGTLTGEKHAFLWERGTMHDLGVLPKGTESIGVGINDNGQVTGYSFTDTGNSDPIEHAFISASHRLIDISPSAGYPRSYGEGINSKGEAVGYLEQRKFGRAFSYRDGRMTELIFTSTSYCEAHAINSRGQLTGEAGFSTGTHHAFILDGENVYDLGTVPGYPFSSGLAINNQRQVTGVITTSSNQQHAFLFQRGKMMDMGTLGGRFSTGNSINNSGSVVGCAQLSDGSLHAFLFRHNTMLDLNTLIRRGDSWTLEQAYSINDKGQITGVGKHNGRQHAFLLLPLDKKTSYGSPRR